MNPPPEPGLPEYVPVAPEEEAVGGDTFVDPTAGLPETVALLKVIPAVSDSGKDCFQLQMHSRLGYEEAKGRDVLRRQGRPARHIADVLARDVDLRVVEECFDGLIDWSSRKSELTSWLTKLRRHLGADLQLIVWDDTDFGIPWELFWHDPDLADLDPAWVGTIAQVIRWVTVHSPGRNMRFSAEKSETTGHAVLYYEDPELVRTPQHSIREQAADPARADSYIDGGSMLGLLRKLRDKENAGRYGLVYVRGHGIHSGVMSEATLADVSLLKVSAGQLDALRDAGTLVFLNVCNSARPVTDPGPGDGTSRNFTEVFLRRHACGVVATLAEVDVFHSASLARRLVADARGGGVHIPEFLREERRNEARGLPDPLGGDGPHGLTHDDLKKILAFFRVSMFAYFGHPGWVFKLGRPRP